MAADVLVYTTTYCPYCVRAKQLLKQKNAAFREIDVSDRDDLRIWLVQASGQRTVPQIFINGRSIGGYTELAMLERSGGLDAQLAESPPPNAEPLPT